MPGKSAILIIDDERDIARGLSIRLQAAGYEVSTAFDGATGLESATRIRPDLIVLDLRMPGIDGFGVLDGLRKQSHTCDIPVIVVSANVVEEARARAMNLGARCFIQKPFQADRLLGTIRDVLTGEEVR